MFIGSQKYQLIYTHKVSETWQNKLDLNMDYTNRHANTEVGKVTRLQIYHKNYRDPKSVESGRNSIPQGEAH